jgi:hypothetical protein
MDDALGANQRAAALVRVRLDAMMPDGVCDARHEPQ